MKFVGRIGLGGRLLTIVLIVVVIDFLVNTVFFERASDFALREDDAERVAEDLVVARRVMDRTDPSDRRTVAYQLSTERFTVGWSSAPMRVSSKVELTTLRRQILSFAPDLAHSALALHLMPVSNGGDIGGSILLEDHSVMSFRAESRDALSLSLGRLLGLALPSILLVLLAWLLLRATLKPLRSLVLAASKVGASDPRPLAEKGQAEVRLLIRAFNRMQDRIHQLLASGSETLLAIGHDLRTPLARLQLRIDDAELDSTLRDELTCDINEMRDLLQSLQTFVESGNDNVPPSRIDIAATAQTLVDNAQDRGALASYRGPDTLEITARPVAIRRALSNLLENAIAYAGNARVTLRRDGGLVELAVEDDGPGIPEDRMGEVLRPFIRLNTARSRDTAGMGLGLPIVDRAVRSEGGQLTLESIPTGGLRATIRLPDALS